MGNAVDAGFHPARAARFQRLARGVEPDVAALHQEMRHVQVVVVHERDPATVGGVDRVAVNLLQMLLAGVVGGMRLAGKEHLHVPAG